MTNICTSIEQSERLIELGLDVNTADMYNVPYFGSDECRYCISQPMTAPNCSPAWSLAALLKLMPNFNIFKRTIECKIETTNHSIDKACEPIDAAFEMVCWLLENKKL